MEKQHQKQKIKTHKFKEKAKWNDKHHIILPRSRGGENIDSNLFLFDVYRHEAWHLLFKNKTLFEIISFLERGKNVKERMELLPNKKYCHSAFHLLFEKKTLGEVIALLQRVLQIKKSQRFRIQLNIAA